MGNLVGPSWHDFCAALLSHQPQDRRVHVRHQWAMGWGLDSLKNTLKHFLGEMASGNDGFNMV